MPEITDAKIIVVIAACGSVGLLVILTIICALCCCRKKPAAADGSAAIVVDSGNLERGAAGARQPDTEAAVQARAVELGELENPQQEAGRGHMRPLAVNNEPLPGPPSPKPTNYAAGGVSVNTHPAHIDSPYSPLQGQAAGNAPSHSRTAGHPQAIEEASGDSPANRQREALRSESIVVNSVGSNIDV